MFESSYPCLYLDLGPEQYKRKLNNRNVVSMVACRSPKSRGACSNQAIPEFNGSLINLVFFLSLLLSPPFPPSYSVPSVRESRKKEAEKRRTNLLEDG